MWGALRLMPNCSSHLAACSGAQNCWGRGEVSPGRGGARKGREGRTRDNLKRPFGWGVVPGRRWRDVGSSVGALSRGAGLALATLSLPYVASPQYLLRGSKGMCVCENWVKKDDDFFPSNCIPCYAALHSSFAFSSQVVCTVHTTLGPQSCPPAKCRQF